MWDNELLKMASEIEKEAGSKKFNLGVDTVAYLKDTKDGQGIEIKIQGTFRHGGISMNDIFKELQKAWKKIDIDA